MSFAELISPTLLRKRLISAFEATHLVESASEKRARIKEATGVLMTAVQWRMTNAVHYGQNIVGAYGRVRNSDDAERVLHALGDLSVRGVQLHKGLLVIPKLPRNNSFLYSIEYHKSAPADARDVVYG